MELENSIYNTSFLQQFSYAIKMLNYRIKRLTDIDVFDKKNNMEYQMVLDSTIVLFRALFLENRNSNYTIQNYFRKTDREQIANKIDEFLDKPYADYTPKYSLRNALKFITDKFVCHQDNVTPIDIGLCNAWISNLNNPYHPRNINSIMREISDILNSAPPIEFSDTEKGQ